jgi:hypothetical protein
VDLCLTSSPVPPLCSRLPEPIPFPQLVCEVVKQLEGAYALLFKSAVYPGELVACRRGSPLILGMKYGIQVGAGLGQGRRGLGRAVTCSFVGGCWEMSRRASVLLCGCLPPMQFFPW